MVRCASCPRFALVVLLTMAAGSARSEAQPADGHLVRECIGLNGKTRGTPSPLQMELHDIVIEPLPFGPRIEEMPRSGSRRVPATIESPLRRREKLLTACYRWARYRSEGLAGDVRVRLDVNPWGQVTDVVASPLMSGGEALAGCVQKVVRGIELVAITPRRTIVNLTVRFSPSGQNRPHRPPIRPAPPAAQAAELDACLVRPASLPTDVTHLRSLGITDFSEAQEQQEQRQKYRDWLRAGRRGPQPTRTPTVVAGTLHGWTAIDSEAVRERFTFNLGPLRKCFVEARTEAPALAGSVRFEVDVDAAGSVRRVAKMDGSLDRPSLVACLQNGLSEVWFEPVMGSKRTELRVQVPLVLRPAAHEPTAVVLPRAENPHVCQERLAHLQAAMLRAPWADDRVLAAGVALADCIEAATRMRQGPQMTEAWRNEVSDRVNGVAFRFHSMGQHMALESAYSSAEPWYRLALRLEQRPAIARQMHYYLGELLYHLERYDDAAQAYAMVGATSPDERLSYDAAQALVVSLEQAEADGVDGDGTQTDAKRLAALRVRLVKACDAFVEKYPTDRGAAAHALAAARSTQALGKKEEARERAEAVLRRWPDDEAATGARELLR